MDGWSETDPSPSVGMATTDLHHADHEYSSGNRSYLDLSGIGTSRMGVRTASSSEFRDQEFLAEDFVRRLQRSQSEPGLAGRKAIMATPSCG